MSLAPITVHVYLTDDKVGFTTASERCPQATIKFDYLPPVGNGDGFLGLEGLVMSFGGCVSTGIVGILRKSSKDVSEYQMSLSAIREEKPLHLQKIIAEVSVKSKDLEEAELQKAVEIAKVISPVCLAIQNNIEIEINYSLTKV